MPCSSARPGNSGTMPAIDTTMGGASLRRSISLPTKPDRHRSEERRDDGAQARALSEQEHDGARGTAERRGYRRSLRSA